MCFPLPPLSPQAPERDAVVLYYGARSAEHMAYGDQLSTWEQAGVTVVPVMSEEGKGYVQDVFKAVGVVFLRRCMWSVLCGVWSTYVVYLYLDKGLLCDAPTCLPTRSPYTCVNTSCSLTCVNTINHQHITYVRTEWQH